MNATRYIKALMIVCIVMLFAALSAPVKAGGCYSSYRYRSYRSYPVYSSYSYRSCAAPIIEEVYLPPAPIVYAPPVVAAPAPVYAPAAYTYPAPAQYGYGYGYGYSYPPQYPPQQPVYQQPVYQQPYTAPPAPVAPAPAPAPAPAAVTPSAYYQYQYQTPVQFASVGFNTTHHIHHQTPAAVNVHAGNGVNVRANAGGADVRVSNRVGLFGRDVTRVTARN